MSDVFELDDVQPVRIFVGCFAIMTLLRAEALDS